MSSLIDSEITRWFRFLSRWALLAGFVNFGLLLAFFFVVLPASQNSPLPEEYLELVAASRNPAMYRLTIMLDVAGWLALGGVFITLAALFARRAPIRSALLAACGVGMVSGFIGAYMRLQGTNELAALYLTAAVDQQAAILQAYVILQGLFIAHFSAGALLWGIAFLLAASAAWSMAEFPRWLTILIALPGLVQVPKSVIEIVAGTDLGFLILLQIPLGIVTYFAVARVFWRGAPMIMSEVSGAPTS